MAQTSDITSKRLISLAPEEWVRWATDVQDVADCEILSGDFQVVRLESDVVILVNHSAAGKFVAFFEIQTRYTLEMPDRMRLYAALAAKKYDLPVFPILLNILPYGKPIPQRYESNFLGLEARQDYKVINLWEISAEVVLAQNLTALIPFVPAMGGADENLIERAHVRLQLDETLRETGKSSEYDFILSLFAQAIMGESTAKKIFGGKMLEIITETPLYKEIVNKGVQKGLQQGREDLLIRMLTRKFGELDEATKKAIHDLSPEQSLNLGDAILDFTVREDFTAWLEANETTVN